MFNNFVLIIFGSSVLEFDGLEGLLMVKYIFENGMIVMNDEN